MATHRAKRPRVYNQNNSKPCIKLEYSTQPALGALLSAVKRFEKY